MPILNMNGEQIGAMLNDEGSKINAESQEVESAKNEGAPVIINNTTSKGGDVTTVDNSYTNVDESTTPPDTRLSLYYIN